MSKYPELIPCRFYHVYNRANGSELLFHNDSNYQYFLEKFYLYLGSFIDIYVYCLLSNHFHFLIRVKEITEKKVNYENEFRKIFICYAMALNKQRNRKGSLFMKPFKRKIVENDDYFAALIFYIHLNPVHHGITKNFQDYKWSSYRTIIGNEPTQIKRSEVLDFFGGREEFIMSHNINKGLYSPNEFFD